MKRALLASLLMVIPALTQAAPAQPHWDYEGKGAPENWGKLSTDFATCHNGKFQSPIDINNVLQAQLPPLDLVFKNTSETVVNNGHTIQVSAKSEDQFTLDGETFQLMQYHFHTPSENHINGKSYPLEAHFVHAAEDGAVAVVAVMFEVGKENSALNPILDAIPDQMNKEVSLQKKLDLRTLFPEKLDYYRFSGSLTTPPCTEGIRWLVMSDNVTLSAEQLARFQSVLKHSNNRPVQPLNGRIIAK
ncbi:carbonic anhydrase family protein [Enterobacteriaceae bacterium ESL0689]|nr:carbonic anhydrase family protein [Enterobacteriaceae bacterium ESL0689]